MYGKIDFTEGTLANFVDEFVEIEAGWRKLLMFTHVLTVVSNDFVAVLANLFVVPNESILRNNLSLLMDRPDTGATRVPPLVRLAGGALRLAPSVAESFDVGCMSALATAHLSRLGRL